VGTVGTVGFLDRFKGGGTAGPDALTAEIAARLRALPTVDSAEGSTADEITVRWTGREGDHTVDLADLRPRWKQTSGFERIELVDHFVESLSPGEDATTRSPTPAAGPTPDPIPDGPAGWEQLRSRVLPALRPAGGGPDCVSWSVGGAVEATVVADGSPVAPGDCEQWGVGEVDVRAAATANLREIDPAPQPVGPGARAWVATAPPGGQAAWLTAPARLLDAVGLAEGVAFVPVAGELVVVDPADTGLLGTILSSTEQIVAEQAEPLTPLPFLLTPTGAMPWIPPEGHPLAAEVEAVRRRAGAA
jgi:hypothetical protein